MKNYLSIVTIMILFTLVSCGKYEEGPAISFLPKKARLVNKWKIEKHFFNDQEQTLSEDEKKGYIEFKKDNTFESVSYDGSVSFTLTGTWEEIDNYSQVKVKYTGVYMGVPYSYETTFTILRLKNNELWIEYKDENNNRYKEYYVSY
ncbi:MAG: lipocalin family protein [Bacteroidales bacterium]|nr:lipocalin family protein [Bacteroidales bacterium]